MIWFTKAAEHGHPVAAYNIGVAYTKGVGVSKNEVKGYMWHYIASSRLEYTPSKRELDQLKEKLTPDQIAEALKSAAEWERAHPDVKRIPP